MWVKGQSGNPGGRPRGYAGVARKIMQSTREGAELVEWALAVWRDESRPHYERAAAHSWLSDRALGKPTSTIDLEARLDVTNAIEQPPEDWELLDLADRRRLIEERIATVALALVEKNE